jgi:hypothetical protein
MAGFAVRGSSGLMIETGTLPRIDRMARRTLPTEVIGGFVI